MVPDTAVSTPTPSSPSPRTTRSCSSRSAGPTVPRTSCRSCATSPPGRTSPTSGSPSSPSTTTTSAAPARSTVRTSPCSGRSSDELARRGLDLPVVWGNRNWTPVHQGRARGRPRRRCAARRRARDQRVLVVLGVPPVPREPLGVAGRADRGPRPEPSTRSSSTRCTRTSTTRASSRPTSTPSSRRTRTSRPTRGSCSSRTPSRTRWRRPPRSPAPPTAQQHLDVAAVVAAARRGPPRAPGRLGPGLLLAVRPAQPAVARARRERPPHGARGRRA